MDACDVGYGLQILSSFVGRQRRDGGHARHGTSLGRAGEDVSLDFYLLLRCPKSFFPALVADGGVEP